jgi:hypothetical protein
MKWQWCLWRGRLRDNTLPFLSDSQETFLTRVGDEAVTERIIRIVTGSRGARLTRTADRLVFRSTYLWPLFPRYWRRKYVHIKNVSQYQAQFHSEMEHAMERYKERLWAYGLRVASAGAFTLATTGLVSSGGDDTSTQTPRPKRETLEQTAPSLAQHSRHHSAALLHSIVSLAPSFDDSVALATFFVFFFVLVKRRRVFIIDNVMRFGQPHGHRRHNVSLMLGDLKCFGQTYPVVLLSTNEGITHVLEDKNVSTFRHYEFPPATDDELYLAIQKSCHQLAPKSFLTANTAQCFSVGDVHRMRSTIGMAHHTSSVRWWMQVYQLVGGDEAAMLRLCSGETAFSTAALQHIALNLDLQGDDVAGTFGLAYSPMVSVHSSLAGYFNAGVADEVCTLLGSFSCPRRLLLCTALLVAPKSRALALGDPVGCCDINVPVVDSFVVELNRILQKTAQGAHGEDVFEEDLTCHNALKYIRERIAVDLPQEMTRLNAPHNKTFGRLDLGSDPLRYFSGASVTKGAF